METESETYGHDINTPLSTPLFMSPSIVPNKYFYFFSFQWRAGARMNFRGTVHRPWHGRISERPRTMQMGRIEHHNFIHLL
jgi:hypothetical protein